MWRSASGTGMVLATNLRCHCLLCCRQRAPRAQCWRRKLGLRATACQPLHMPCCRSPGPENESKPHTAARPAGCSEPCLAVNHLLLDQPARQCQHAPSLLLLLLSLNSVDRCGSGVHAPLTMPPKQLPPLCTWQWAWRPALRSPCACLTWRLTHCWPETSRSCCGQGRWSPDPSAWSPAWSAAPAAAVSGITGLKFVCVERVKCP